MLEIPTIEGGDPIRKEIVDRSIMEFRVRGRGLPLAIWSPSRGDIIVRVEIEKPPLEAPMPKLEGPKTVEDEKKDQDPVASKPEPLLKPKKDPLADILGPFANNFSRLS